MATLQNINFKNIEVNSTLYYHVLVESIKMSLLDRNAHLHDPTVDNWNFHQALDAKQMNIKQAIPWHEEGRPADTIWMAATDSQGRTACLMQSLFHDFGSGCVIGDTGVVWQNRGAGFNPNPNHVNAWRAGRRPAHTLNPSCYLADNGEQWFFGSQGGDGQPQTQLVLATQFIDYQKNIEEALFAPRFLLGRSFFDSTDNLKLESNIQQHTMDELEKLGHEIEVIPELSPYCGQAGIIKVEPSGSFSAMHDPRGQGVSLAVD